MTRKQERARQRRRWEKRQVVLARKQAQRDRLRRIGAVVGTVVVVAAVLVVLGVTVGNRTPSTDAAASPSASTSASPTGTTSAGCEQPPAPLGTASELSLPDKRTAEGKTFRATLTTNCGDIVLRLDGKKAPQAVAAFVALSKANYYQDSPCHRLVTAKTLKVLQCGDPTGTGSGNPGFGYGVENAPKDGKYPRGTLAMARTSDAKKGTGAQFFIVYGDSSLPDPNGYTVFGSVEKGLDIVDKIAAQGVAPNDTSPDDGTPAAPISILRVAVTEEKS